MELTRELDNEMIYDKEPDAGINPGLVSGISYTDSNGNNRNKYQVLTTFSNESINNLRRSQPLGDGRNPPLGDGFPPIEGNPGDNET